MVLEQRLGRTEWARSGVTLMLVLGVLFVLAAFAFIVRLLSHGAYNEVSLLNHHLHAVAVGEAGYSNIVARLSATPWAKRWFKSGPDSQFDIQEAGGTYEYMIRDSVQPAPALDDKETLVFGPPNMVDLLIRATYARSTVTMFWRVFLVEDALDKLSRVVPLIFTFASPSARPNPTDVDELSQTVSSLVGQRSDNIPGFVTLATPLLQATTAPEIAAALSTKPAGSVVDDISPWIDGPSASNQTRIIASRTTDQPFAEFPPAPPPPIASVATSTGSTRPAYVITDYPASTRDSYSVYVPG